MEPWYSLVPAIGLSCACLAPDAPAQLTALTPEAEPVPLPLQGTEVHLAMTGGLIEAVVVQTFSNTCTAAAIEAVYGFPLPARATVMDMEIHVGSRWIKSEVQKKEQAIATYAAARDSGKKTAVVHRERPNRFTTSVANILPGETVDVYLTYLECADFRDGSYIVTFPMVSGTRYLPDAMDPELDGAMPGMLVDPVLPSGIDPGYRCALTLDIEGLPVAAVECGTHAIAAGPHPDLPHATRVTFEHGQEIPDADFCARILLEEASVPVATAHVSGNETEAYALITVIPALAGALEDPAAAPPREVLFLLDTSGSMEGEPLAQAKRGLRHCLARLQSHDRFNLVTFASDYTTFADAPAPATDDRLATVDSFIDRLNAAGGTEMQPALEALLDQPTTPGTMRLVFLLTDGDVGNEHSLVRLLGQRLGQGRLFPIGIGSAPNETLVRGMAEAGRGEAVFLRSEDDIDEALRSLFAAIESPQWMDLSLAWSGSPSVGVYPSKIPDVYAGRPVQLVAWLPASYAGILTLQGTYRGAPREIDIPIEVATDTTYAAIDCLFGQARVQELMLDWTLAPTPVAREQARQGIVETGLAFGLVTRFTSRVAVEHLVTRRPDGTLETQRIPTLPPRGQALSDTGTLDTTRLLLAMALLVLAGGYWRAGLCEQRTRA